MLFFPPCKINIGLQILRRRPDGFHDLELSFIAVPEVCDVLEIVPLPQRVTGGPPVTFTQTGCAIQLPQGQNLVEKAKDLIQAEAEKKGRTLPPCHIHLHKNIPAGSGLGGGSSDAAYTLTGLNSLFQLGFNQNEMEEMAARLCSDCAFFTRNEACIGRGKGEILTPLSTGHNQSLYTLICIPENLSISTADAYRHCTPEEGRPSLAALLQNPIEKWHETVENDFEKSLFPRYPVLAQIKEKLYENGAVYASLSGSGSAVFGLFLKETFPKIEGCTTLSGRISIA